jgi:hypothetical protein
MMEGPSRHRWCAPGTLHAEEADGHRQGSADTWRQRGPLTSADRSFPTRAAGDFAGTEMLTFTLANGQAD